jgi:hypothetical protein
MNFAVKSFDKRRNQLLLLDFMLECYKLIIDNKYGRFACDINIDVVFSLYLHLILITLDIIGFPKVLFRAMASIRALTLDIILYLD